MEASGKQDRKIILKKFIKKNHWRKNETKIPNPEIWTILNYGLDNDPHFGKFSNNFLEEKNIFFKLTLMTRI